MHIRGTDKVVHKKVPPEAYFPFADAWVEAHPGGLLFVATDEAAHSAHTHTHTHTHCSAEHFQFGPPSPKLRF